MRRYSLDYSLLFYLKHNYLVFNGCEFFTIENNNILES